MTYPNTLDRGDPADFAEHLYDKLTGLLPDEFSSHAPADYATYLAARAALSQTHPELATAGVGHPLTDLDEAAHAWADKAFMAGVRFGVAAAELRRTLFAAPAALPASPD